MRRLIFGLLIIVAISGCAPTTTAPKYYKPVLKENVIPLVKKYNPTYCGYRGRAVLHFEDPLNKQSALLNLSKKCNGDADIAILGPFGAIYARVYLRGVSYNIVMDGKDVTDSVDLVLQHEVIRLIQKYMRTPPVDLDDTYFMFYDDQYYFVKDDVEVQVSNDFMITGISIPGYLIKYEWKGSQLKSFTVKSKYVESTLEFLKRWSAE